MMQYNFQLNRMEGTGREQTIHIKTEYKGKNGIKKTLYFKICVK